MADVSVGHPPPNPVEVEEWFIQKCLCTVEKVSDKRQILLFYECVLGHRKPEDPLPFTLSKIEI